jgi:protein-tyrosine phosphatase
VVLFVCTGNIFRSLTAEYALRRELGAQSAIAVTSAGIHDYPHVVRDNVRNYLLAKGLDVSSHRRRTLTREILAPAKLVIAMSTDHQQFLHDRFGVRAPVFLEACGGACEALPDIEDVVLDYRTNAAAVDAHVRKTIDIIIGLTPRLARSLPVLVQELRSSR